MATSIDFRELKDRDGLREVHPAFNVSDRTFGRYEKQGLEYIDLAGKHWYQLHKACEFALSRQHRRNPPRKAA